MQNRAIILDMTQPGAERALQGWAHIDDAERAKWAHRPAPLTLHELDAEIAAQRAAYRK